MRQDRRQANRWGRQGRDLFGPGGLGRHGGGRRDRGRHRLERLLQSELQIGDLGVQQGLLKRQFRVVLSGRIDLGPELIAFLMRFAQGHLEMNPQRGFAGHLGHLIGHLGSQIEHLLLQDPVTAFQDLVASLESALFRGRGCNRHGYRLFHGRLGHGCSGRQKTGRQERPHRDAHAEETDTAAQ